MTNWRAQFAHQAVVDGVRLPIEIGNSTFSCLPHFPLNAYMYTHFSECCGPTR